MYPICAASRKNLFSSVFLGKNKKQKSKKKYPYIYIYARARITHYDDVNFSVSILNLCPKLTNLMP